MTYKLHFVMKKMKTLHKNWLCIIKWSKNSSQNTTKAILANMGVGLSELHVSAFYSGHHQVTIADYKRYTNMLNVG